MAAHDMVMSDAAVYRQLQIAKNHIKTKNYRQAKMVLNDLIDHPTAFRWLEKIEEMEMLNENMAVRTESKVEPDHKRLAQVTGLFLENGWTIGTRVGSTVVVEKKKSPGTLMAIVVSTLFGLVGAGLMLVASARAGIERITLVESSDGSVRLTGSGSLDVAIDNPQEALEFAQSVKQGMSYALPLALGIASTIVWLIVLI
jgi:hypothetical protein